MIESSIRSRDLETNASFVDVKRFDKAVTNTVDDPTHIQIDMDSKRNCTQLDIMFKVTERLAEFRRFQHVNDWLEILMNRRVGRAEKVFLIININKIIDYENK